MGLITTRRAAELLRITAVRVRQLIQTKQLSSEKAGRDHLLDEADVVRFNKEGRRGRGRPKKDWRK
jgi:site-specific DNA-methyltransferase (adenine-specific)